MTALKEHEHHIPHPSADRKGFAICGAAVTQFDWTFTDIGHAWLTLIQGQFMRPCPACATAVVDGFKGDKP